MSKGSRAYKGSPLGRQHTLPDYSIMAFLWLLSCFALLGTAFSKCL